MTELVYPDTSGCSQLLLIDSNIQESNIFVSSVNSNTFPVTYTTSSSKTELLSLLRSKFTSITRIGIVFHSYQSGEAHPFLDNQMFFDETELYNENVTFLISLIQEFQVKNIDYLACNTLNYPNWVKYYEIIKQTGATVGASNNRTGNMMYTGDWVLESINQNIEMIYFTEKIEFYKYTLDGPTPWITSTTPGNPSIGFRAITANSNGLFLIAGTSGGGSIYKINRTTKTIALFFEYNTTNYDTTARTTWDITTDGTDLYIQTKHVITTNSYTTIYRITDTHLATGRNVKSTRVPWSDTTITFSSTDITQPCGICYDGTYVYGSTGGNITTNKIEQFNSGGTKSTLIIVNAGTVLTSAYNGLSFTAGRMVSIGNYIYVVGSRVGVTEKCMINRYKSSTLKIDVQSYARGLRNNIGITCLATDGTYLYVSYNNFIIKVNTDDYGSLATTDYYGNPITNGIWLSGFSSIKCMTFYDSVMYIVDYSTIYTVRINSSITFDTSSSQYLCFKEGSLILTDQGYVPVQELRKGHLVKTISDGLLPIHMICKQTIEHKPTSERIGNQLYQCSQENYPEVFEPLVITGHHSILVDDFISEEQKQQSIKANGDLYITGQKYRLPASVDERATIYNNVGIHTIYHFSLENDKYYGNYGVYANGLLVETCSKRYLKELSHMEVI